MTYRPATGDALAASLGVPASDAPTVTCDGCDLVLRAVTTRGGMPAWLRANRAPPGWSMERGEDDEGRVLRVDLCPRCRR